MNKEWSELNNKLKLELKKKNSYSEGINTLLQLRQSLMKQIDEFRESLCDEDFVAMPYMNAKGYHSKTIAYSLFHILRIEDITVHSLIKNDTQVFFEHDYKKRMNSSIVTTGNELVKEEIAKFSEELKLDELYNYIHEVDRSTTDMLNNLTYQDLKHKMTNIDRQRLHELNTVSEDENAIWLIDYWCGKNVLGLICMPMSRHWIMHVEACIRILNKLRK